MNISRQLIPATLLLSVACGSKPPTLPCEVEAVFRARCQSCHAQTPLSGSPMALINYEDTQKGSVSKPSAPVWELIATRAHDTANPMPPDGPLTAEQLAAIDRWTSAGAKPGTDSSCNLPDPVVAQKLELPCPPSEQVHFRAHGQTLDEGYLVPADSINTCYAFRSPFTVPTQATVFAPIVGDARVLHHMILYQTATPQLEGVPGPCVMPGDATYVSGWAPGGTNNVLPEDVGQGLPGKDGWFILETHYSNPTRLADVRDQSGIAMCVTTTPRAHNAAVTIVGSWDIAIPPMSEHATTALCTPAATEPVHVVSTAPHMHRLGASFRTEILRGGDPSKTEPLVDVPRWNFNGQATYPSKAVIQPGDKLRTTCQYTNTGTEKVFNGEHTEDEMCFNYVLAWPAGALASANGSIFNVCVDPVR